MTTPVPFAEWQALCLKVAEELRLPIDDVWAQDDPYDVLELAREAWSKGQTPSEFVGGVFEDDAAAIAGSDAEWDDSMRSDFDIEY